MTDQSEFLLNLFSLDKDDVLAIYPFGSRLYQSHHEKSDYDYFVVVKDDFPSESYYFELVNGNIDLNCYKKSLFLQKLNNNELQFLMCYFQPKETKILEIETFPYHMSYSKLKVNVLKEASRHLHSLAPRHEKEGDQYQALKSRIQAMRDLLFGLQIVKHGKIVDYTEANSYKDVNFAQVYERLVSEFESLVEPKFERIHQLDTISFLKGRSISDLDLYFDVQITRQSDFDFYRLDASSESSSRSKINNECNGLIINGSHEVICCPMSRILDVEDFFAEKLDWNNTWAFPYIDAPISCIFYAKDKNLRILTSREKFIGIYKDSKWIPLDRQESELVDAFNSAWIDSNIEFTQSEGQHLLVQFTKARIIQFYPPVNFERISGVGAGKNLAYSLEPFDYQGIILFDQNNHFVKISSPQYDELKSNWTSPKKIWTECILRRIDRDSILQYSSFRDSFLEQEGMIKKKIDELKDLYASIVDLSKKDFATRSSQSQFKIILNRMKNENVTNVETFIAHLPSNLLEVFVN